MFSRMELVVTLLVAGTILLLAETVLPGMIAGILGGLCLLAGIIAGYVEFGARTGNYILVGVSVALIGGFCAWVKFFPDSKFGRVFISKGAVGEIRTEKPELLHQAGVAFTQLRPSGTAIINGKRVDVVTEGALIEKGTPLKVIALEGMRVVVRALPQPDSPAAPASTHPQQSKTT
jgi:membrane-bound serine protease (ClpP class)